MTDLPQDIAIAIRALTGKADGSLTLEYNRKEVEQAQLWLEALIVNYLDPTKEVHEQFARLRNQSSSPKPSQEAFREELTHILADAGEAMHLSGMLNTKEQKEESFYELHGATSAGPTDVKCPTCGKEGVVLISWRPEPNTLQADAVCPHCLSQDNKYLRRMR